MNVEGTLISLRTGVLFILVTRIYNEEIITDHDQYLWLPKTQPIAVNINQS